MAFLDRFRLIALDMHGTFMFGEDRFGVDENFARTWRTVTGADAGSLDVEGIVRALHRQLDRFYCDPAHHDDFPTVAEALADLPEARNLTSAEKAAVEAVLARHEMGRVPAEYVPVLRELAERHRLALLSNIWSAPAPWLRQLQECGLGDAFSVRLFSSEIRFVKPSPRIFAELLARAGVAARDAVYVGDDPLRDIAGAKRAGLTAVWVGHGRHFDPAASHRPDREIESLIELAELGD